jgi:hypothetical protein
MRGDRLADAVELDEDRALRKAVLVALRRDSARQDAPAGPLLGGTGLPGAGRENFGVVDGAADAIQWALGMADRSRW